MKTKLFALVALLTSFTAFATSPAPSILKYEQIPTYTGIKKAQFQSMDVYANGVVVASVRIGNKSKIVKVMNLSKSKMYDLNDMIRGAARGKLVTIPSPARCFAPASFIHHYTANRGRTILYRGHICAGNLLVNQSADARQLVVEIDELRKDTYGNNHGEF